MIEPQTRDVVTLLDACAIISLYASRRMSETLYEVDGPVAVVRVVVDESLYVRHGGDGDDASEIEPIELGPLIELGRMSVIEPDNEAGLQTFVDLVAEYRLDDGEALTAALAIHRGCVMVTDDGKVERRLVHRVRLRSTLDLIKTWADRRAIDAGTLAQVLADVRDRRSYVPPVRHPLKSWWDRFVQDG